MKNDNPLQARNQTARYDTTEKGTIRRLRVMRATAVILLFILSVAMIPSAAESASWLDKWNDIKKQGKQVYDDTVEAITPPSDEQSDQQQEEPTAKTQPTYSNDQVRQVQNLLTDLGYNPGPVDGVFGGTTANAIKAYQEDHNLIKTGELSDELIAHMQNTLSVQPAVAMPKSPSGGTSIAATSSQSVKNTGGTTQELSTQDTAGATPEFVEEILALTPAGVFIGLDLSAAKAVLEKRGYKVSSPYSACDYLKGVKGVDTSTVEISLGTDINRLGCIDGEPVRKISIHYSIKNATGISIVDLLKELENRLGAVADCGERTAKNINGCTWDSPPQAPSILKIRLHGSLLQNPTLISTGHRLKISKSPPDFYLSLSLLAKPYVKLSESSPVSSDSEPDLKQADTTIYQNKVERSTQDVTHLDKSARVDDKGHMQIEGITLGMTPEEFADKLRTKGWRFDVDQKGDRMFQKWPPRRMKFGQTDLGGPDARYLAVDYKFKRGGVGEDRVKKVTLVMRKPTKNDGTRYTQAEEAAWLQEIFTRFEKLYGKPDSCVPDRFRKLLNKRCEWTLQTDNGREVLRWQLPIAGGFHLQLF